METEFFGSEFGQGLLKRAISRVESLPPSDKVVHLRDALRIIAGSGKEFDKSAASNVSWIGKSLASEVEALESSNEPGPLDELYASVYRFVSEFELSLPEKSELGRELRVFVDHARYRPEDFAPSAQQQIAFANHGMPLLIMKRLLGSDVIKNLRNVENFEKDVSARLTSWDDKLSGHEEIVSRLANALKEYETGFNFVGLHKGFDDLAKDKEAELRSMRRSMLVLGVLVLIPLSAELVFLYTHLEQFEKLRWALLLSAIPVLSLTVVFVYYFRLAVRAVDGAKSQLLQLELRKTLCRFIQSYVEYAQRLKEGGAGSLGKFESVIFSAIVNSDEKMPATFDGIEQLAKLVGAVKSS